mmetsp:Transcript_33743/g.32790  ORF Transcript_33743/g.32790 Transcript_33743/m.32790 type:complete len:100 (-) Transcript_33743:499-798(-)
MKKYPALRKNQKILVGEDLYMDTGMFWGGKFIVKILRLMKEYQKNNQRQKEYISYAMKKKKQELKNQKQQKNFEMRHSLKNIMHYDENAISFEKKLKLA